MEAQSVSPGHNDATIVTVFRKWHHTERRTASRWCNSTKPKGYNNGPLVPVHLVPQACIHEAILLTMPVRPLWIIFAASLSQHVTHLFPPCVGATLYWCPSYVGTTLVSVLCRYNTRVRLISGATLVCLVSMQHSCPSCVGTTLVSVLCRYNTCVRRVSITPVYVFCLYRCMFFACTKVFVFVTSQYRTCVHFESVYNMCPSWVSTTPVPVLCQYMCIRLVSVQHVYPSCVSTTCVSVLH